MSNGKPTAWRCSICGYNHTGDAPPDTCPICAVGAEDFKPWKEMLPAMDSVEETGGPGMWRCIVCGYVHHGDAPPETCPVCGAAASEFEPYEEASAPPEKAASPGKWRCKICGYLHEGPEPPDICPLCGAGRDQFEAEGKPADTITGAGTGLRVLVAGAGIAGISAVEALREASPDAAITLVSQEELPYYRLNLTRFLAGEVGEGELPIHPGRGTPRTGSS